MGFLAESSRQIPAATVALSALLVVLLANPVSVETTMSQIRQNFHEESEGALNKHINWELYGSYVYLSMEAYFRRDDVALHGFADIFKQAREKQLEHVKKFIDYQNKRGGRVVLKNVDKPSKDEWGTGLDGLVAAVDLEKTLNQGLIDLVKEANKNDDHQLEDFVKSEFMKGKIKWLKQLGDYVTQLKLVGKGLGEWEFDKYLRKQAK